MSDPLSTLRLPSRPLPAGGDVLAITTGRRALRRRRIAAVVVSGASAAALVAAAVVMTGGAQQGDSLSTVTPAGGATLPRPGAVPTSTLPPGVLPSPVPTPSQLPVGIGPSASENPSTSPTPAETSAAPEAHGPFIGFEPTAADGGPTVTRTMNNDPTFCEQNTQVADYRHPDGWCSTLTTSAPNGFVAGHRISLTFETCKAPESGAMTLHFDNRMEVDLTASESAADGSEIPRWSWDNRFDFPAGAHTLTFNPGDCATWVMTWSGQDYDGYAVPEGDYDPLAYLTASEYTSDNADYPPPMGILRHGMNVAWPS